MKPEKESTFLEKRSHPGENDTLCRKDDDLFSKMTHFTFKTAHFADKMIHFAGKMCLVLKKVYTEK
jgi:hypothetical protein